MSVLSYKNYQIKVGSFSDTIQFVGYINNRIQNQGGIKNKTSKRSFAGKAESWV